MFHIIMNLKRKFQFKNRGVRRLEVSAANPNNPLPMQSYGLLGFTKTFTPTYLLTNLLRGLLLMGMGLLWNGLAHADGFCGPGAYDPNNGRAPAITCVPLPGNANQQRAPQQPAPQWESRWGAIATDGPNDALGVATDKRSKREASQAAMQDCQSKGGVNCKVDTAYDNQCAAVVVGDGAYNVPIAAAVDQAVAIGMKTCRASGRANCHVYYSACSLPVRIQ